MTRLKGSKYKGFKVAAEKVTVMFMHQQLADA